MGQSKHTPGPLKFVAPCFIGTDEPDSQTVAYLDDHRNRSPRPESEMHANGLLFAAAPEMLEALQKHPVRIRGEPDAAFMARLEAWATKYLDSTIAKAAGKAS